MVPKIDDSPLDSSSIHANQVVFDTIYTPEWTRLLLDAKLAGAVTLSGIDMFIRQACAQSQMFTDGLEPPLESMAKALRLTLKPA